MPNTYFKLFPDLLEAWAALTDEECGRLVRALAHYQRTGQVPALPGSERILFPACRAQIDRDNQVYENRCGANAENGKKGGRPKSETNPKNPMGFSEPKQSEKSQDKEKDKEKDEEKEPPPDGGGKKKKFVPPTLAEVASYVASRHSPVEPQVFLDFYGSKGWMVGRTPMKDWKAACRNAESWDRWARKGGQTSDLPDL